MKLYVKAIKAYGYVLHLFGILLPALVLTLVIIIIVNSIGISLSEYRMGVENHAIILLLTILITLAAYWHKLIPTLRTIFKIDRTTEESTFSEKLSSNKSLIILTITGICLLLFAFLQNIELFTGINNHPARYGYIGNFFLCMSLLVFIAKITAPIKAKVDTSIFMNDETDEQSTLSASQNQSVDYLKEILSNGMPRSVALTGDWGSGKTMVYNRARTKISETNKDIIWVDFDPWRYASEEALVKGFYESIAKKIDEEIPGLQNALYRMVKSVDQLVSKSDSSGILQLLTSFVKETSGHDKNPDTLVKAILDREGKRLVIILDNIERQYDKERAYRALQLVHHAKTMGKDNVQVLCIYEKAALLLAAPDHMSSKEEYLEKFSEIEINVPPPEEFSLRAQLEELLDDPKYSQYFPHDFDLKLSPASVRDIKSHRGIIRAFNELLLEFKSTNKRIREFQDEDENIDVITYVNYTDRFLMGHLKLKYPSIYRDIAEHRGLYTQHKDREEDISNMFMDKEEVKKNRLEKFDDLFKEAGLSSEKKNIVVDFLIDLFPVLNELFKSHNSYVDLAELRNQRKVGHRDVLDAYFALTTSQNAYLQHEKWIKELLAGIGNDDDAGLINRFEKYTERAREDSTETDSITLLRNELLKQKHKSYQLRAFRAWMRAILKDNSSIADDDNRALGRILSALSDIVQKNQPDDRLVGGRFIFEDITLYITKPYTALLLLLFLLPEQGNGYLKEYINYRAFKQGGLYQIVLKWVDSYFFENKINIYKDYEYRHWAFIAFQWAQSIRSGGAGINTKVRGAEKRYIRVNKYLFRMLNKDDQVAYNFIHKRFWYDEVNARHMDETVDWQVNSETVTPYIPENLMRLTEKIVKSNDLTTAQKELLKPFINNLSVYIKDLH